MPLTKVTNSMISGACLNVFDFMTSAQISSVAARDLTEDVTTPLQNAIDAASESNTPLHLPAGTYKISSELTVVGSITKKFLTVYGDGIGTDGAGGSTIYYDGTASATVSVVSSTGMAKCIFSDLQLFSNDKAGYAFKCSPDSGTHASYNFVFTRVAFNNATNYGFYMTGSSHGAQFTYQNCLFYKNQVGFYNINPNSLDNNFISCGIDSAKANDSNSKGIFFAAGSFLMNGCEFARNWYDVYLTACSNSTMVNCFTEQSRTFIYGDNRNIGMTLSLIGCRSSSFPWSWWKWDESSRTQPTNDFTQWVTIIWNRNGALNLIGCNWSDPWNGANVGSIPPLSATGNTITTWVPDSKTDPININNIGSSSQSAANTYWSTLNTSIRGPGGSGVVRAIPIAGISGDTIGTGTYNASQYPCHIFSINLNTSTTLTPQVSTARPGDRMTYVVTQGNAGANTITFNNSNVAGGIFTPTSGAGKISTITFEYIGTSGKEWVEVGRALDLS